MEGDRRRKSSADDDHSHSTESPGLLRLQNGPEQGRNGCYANSAVNVLLSLNVFGDFLRDAKEEFHNCPPRIIDTLLSLLDDKKTGTETSLTELRKCVKPSDNVNWRTNLQQQDCAEFLSSLLETIEDEIKDNDFLTKSFRSLFNLTTVQKFICNQCRQPHIEPEDADKLEEVQRPVILPIHGTNRLDTAWMRVRDETVPVERRTCNTCGPAGIVEKVSEVTEYPAVFSAHLKRFAANGAKNGKRMIVPRTLQLSDTSPTYYLVGASHHEGNSMRNGHYKSILLYEDETWLVDDDTARKLDSEETDLELSTAYFFVYSQKMDKSPVKKKPRLGEIFRECHIVRDPTLPEFLLKMLNLERTPNLKRVDIDGLKKMYNYLKCLGPDNLTNMDLDGVKESDLRECVIKKMQDLIQKKFPDDYAWQKNLACNYGIKPPPKKSNSGSSNSSDRQGAKGISRLIVNRINIEYLFRFTNCLLCNCIRREPNFLPAKGRRE